MIKEDYNLIKRFADYKNHGMQYWVPSDTLRPKLEGIELPALLRGTLRIVDGSSRFNHQVKGTHSSCNALFSMGSKPYSCPLCSTKSGSPKVLRDAVDPLISNYIEFCLQRQSDRRSASVIDLTNMAFDLSLQHDKFKIDWDKIIEGAKRTAVALGSGPDLALRQTHTFTLYYVERVVNPYLVYFNR